MNIISGAMNYLVSFSGLVLLLLGIIKKRPRYAVFSLWISIIALMLQYQEAGGEILGTYFNYEKASLYTVTALVLIISLLYIFAQAPYFQQKITRSFLSLLAAILVTAVILITVNVWMNARFISERLSGTAIIQVAAFDSLDYCSYRYVFYKIGTDGKMKYLCPNRYGLIPSTGKLIVAPELLMKQLTQQQGLPSKKSKSQ